MGKNPDYKGPVTEAFKYFKNNPGLAQTEVKARLQEKLGAEVVEQAWAEARLRVQQQQQQGQRQAQPQGGGGQPTTTQVGLNCSSRRWSEQSCEGVL